MVPKWKDMGDRIREDILFRLRWNVLATLDSIEIATRHHNEVVFVPFFGNPSAQESIAQPPLNRVEVNIGEFLNKRSLDYGEEEDRYKPPAALIIENVDGSPITVGHYVTQAHAYLNEHIEEIKKVKGELYGKVEKRDDGTTVRSITYGQPYLPPDTKIFFKRVCASIDDDHVRLTFHYLPREKSTFPQTSSGLYSCVKLTGTRSAEAKNRLLGQPYHCRHPRNTSG